MMGPLLAIGQGVLFLIGTLIFIAVFTAAFGLGYARFAEMGDRAEDRERRRSALSSLP